VARDRGHHRQSRPGVRHLHGAEPAGVRPRPSRADRGRSGFEPAAAGSGRRLPGVAMAGAGVGGGPGDRRQVGWPHRPAGQRTAAAPRWCTV
jgi:hypothetical protein